MECPLCNRIFPPASINVHVNNCLNTSEAKHSDSGAEGTGKRKSTATQWGSLQPMREVKQTGSCAVSPPNTSKKPKIASRDAAEIESKRDANQNGLHPPAKDADSFAPTKNLLIPFPSGNEPETGGQTSCLAGSVASTMNKPEQLFAPLAERMRPKTLEDYMGQEKAVGMGSMLHSLLLSDHIPSLILWGPPGCGKTTLAKIIANNCRSRGSAKFLSLSAAVCGVNEVKETIKIARNDQKMFRKKTVMFLDEIHRFNKAQQDVLLPHVEDGTITLIGATTENPSFQVNSALLSRCRVIVLEKLSAESIVSILHRALPHIRATVAGTEQDSEKMQNGSDRCEKHVSVDPKGLELLSQLVDGDARAALNGLQMAVEAKACLPQFSSTNRGSNSSSSSGSHPAAASLNKRLVTVEDIKEGLQRSHILYDKTGEEHYNIISALHKSLRGSDASAALYWLARMLEGGENPLYIARRLIRFASEDVGLADPQALPQAVAAYQGCHLIGMPECEVLLAQCAVYLARAPKSVEIYKAYGKAKACIRDHKGPLPSVPLHLRNAPTRLMKNLGYSKGYKYNPDYTEPVDQDYFPEQLIGTDFFV